MAEFTFTCSQTLERPRDEVFDFFSKAENLERITPDELNFHIITPKPIVVKAGAMIEYKLSLHGIPMYWKTEITKWNPPFEFQDTQLSGPYKQWIHTHRFTELSPTTTLMEDVVRYRLPLEPLGDIAQFLIARQIKGIFDYRQKAVTAAFE